MTPLDQELDRATELIALGRDAYAMELLTRLLTDYPEDTERTHRLFAVAHLRQRRYAQADAAARESLRVDPERPEAHYLLALALRGQGNDKAAAAAAARTVELAPEWAPGYQGLAQVWSDLRRHRDAEAAARRALELDPDDADSWAALGYVLHSLKPAEADAAYEQALHRDPHDSTVIHNLGALRVASGRPREGARMVVDALATPRSGPLGVVVLDQLVIRIVQRMHWMLLAASFLLVQGLNVIAVLSGSAWALVAVNVCLVALTVLAGIVIVRRLLRPLSEALPYPGDFLRGFARRDRLGAAWAAMLVLSMLALLVGVVVAVLAAALERPDAARLALVGPSLALYVLILGVVLSWVRVPFLAWRLKRDRYR